MDIPSQITDFLTRYPFIIFAVFAVGMYWAAREYDRRRTEKLKNIALTLGFNFNGGQTPEERQAFYSQHDYWMMTGTYNGVRVKIFGRIEGSGKNRQLSTFFVALFNEPLAHNIFIAKDHALYYLLSVFVNKNDIEINDPELDKKYLLRGDSKEAVTAFIKNPQNQMAMDELLEYSALSSVNSEGVWYKRAGFVTKENVYREVLDKITALSTRFQA